jgi:hypothetical protein
VALIWVMSVQGLSGWTKMAGKAYSSASAALFGALYRKRRSIDFRGRKFG